MIRCCLNSEIGYTTDCLYSFRDRQKTEFCMLELCTFFPPAINFCRNNSQTMNRFMIFMRTNQDDNGIDYKCYVKNLLRLFNKNIARERIDKRFQIGIIWKWNKLPNYFWKATMKKNYWIANSTPHLHILQILWNFLK